MGDGRGRRRSGVCVREVTEGEKVMEMKMGERD